MRICSIINCSSGLVSLSGSAARCAPLPTLIPPSTRPSTTLAPSAHPPTAGHGPKQQHRGADLAYPEYIQFCRGRSQSGHKGKSREGEIPRTQHPGAHMTALNLPQAVTNIRTDFNDLDPTD